jgi:hypothetical protein
MNKGELRDEARRLARAGNEATLSDDLFDAWLNEANNQVQRDTRWLSKKRVYYTREYFSVGTDEGFGITFDTATGEIELLGVTSALSNVSGTVLAAALQTEWNTTNWGTATGTRAADTGIAVSYSTSNRKFTVTSQAATYTSTGIIIFPPLYNNSTGTHAVNDLTFKLFGVTAQSSASTYAYTGDTVPYCMSEYPLPSDFMEIKEIRYDDKSYPLSRVVYRSRDTGAGIPSSYYIKDDHFGLVPEPADGGKIIEFDYYYVPESITVGAATDASEYEYPHRYDYALIWYTIFLYKYSIGDEKGLNYARAMYENEKLKMKQDRAARGGSAVNIFGGGHNKDVNRYRF